MSRHYFEDDVNGGVLSLHVHGFCDSWLNCPAWLSEAGQLKEVLISSLVLNECLQEMKEMPKAIPSLANDLPFSKSALECENYNSL